MSARAILAFFSPCDYELPQKHLASTIKWIVGMGLPATLAQVVRPGQEPQYAPPGVANLVFESADVMFFKENLWNIAARRSTENFLFFFDTDVVFSSERWLADSLKLLGRYDIVQPYEVATWLSRDRVPDYFRKPTALALGRGLEPDSGVYHPGFGWGMTRSAFDKLGGWYDRHPAGGSDTAFAYAHYPGCVDDLANTHCGLSKQFWHAESYKKYRENALSLGMKFSVAKGIAVRHLWHGSWRHRGYVTRNQVFKTEASGEYPVEYRPDGLLRWTDEEQSQAALHYFLSRKEDG